MPGAMDGSESARRSPQGPARREGHLAAGANSPRGSSRRGGPLAAEALRSLGGSSESAKGVRKARAPSATLTERSRRSICARSVPAGRSACKSVHTRVLLREGCASTTACAGRHAWKVRVCRVRAHRRSLSEREGRRTPPAAAPATMHLHKHTQASASSAARTSSSASAASRGRECGMRDARVGTKKCADARGGGAARQRN